MTSGSQEWPALEAKGWKTLCSTILKSFSSGEPSLEDIVAQLAARGFDSEGLPADN